MESLVSPNPEFWSGKKVLVTGATGFKGSWMSLWLVSMGAEVTSLSIGGMNDGLNLWDEAGIADDVTDIRQDIRDLEGVLKVFQDVQPEIVLHLAAQSLVLPSYEDPVRTYATNVMGTVHIFEAVKVCSSVKAVVNVTSDKCYENREWHWAYREDEAMGGSDPYSNSKGCSELVTSAYRRSFFQAKDTENTVALASVRAGNVIGGGDWSVNRLIPDSMIAMSNGETLQVRSPYATRPWQHVLEPVSGYLVLAEKLFLDDGLQYADGWNFGPNDEDAKPVGYLVPKLASLWGEGASWEVIGNNFPHEAKFLEVDSSKARAELGWSPRLNLDNTLAWTVEWYKAFYQGADAKKLTVDQIKKYREV